MNENWLPEASNDILFFGTNSPKPKDIYNYEKLRKEANPYIGEVGTRDTVIFTLKKYF